MAYLVHHTLNRNGTYTDGKRNLLVFDEKIITDKSQHKKSSETSKSTPFSIQNQWKKCDFEYLIHGIINSCEIEDVYFGRVLSIFFFFLPKKLHNDFFWKQILVILKDEYHLFCCRCFQIFYYFMFPEKST